MSGQEMDPKLVAEVEQEVHRQIRFWRREDVVEAVGPVAAQKIREALNQGTDSVRLRAGLSRNVVREDNDGNPTKTAMDYLMKQNPI